MLLFYMYSCLCRMSCLIILDQACQVIVASILSYGINIFMSVGYMIQRGDRIIDVFCFAFVCSVFAKGALPNTIVRKFHSKLNERHVVFGHSQLITAFNLLPPYS